MLPRAVESAVILDGRVDHAVLLSLLGENSMAGTSVTAVEAAESEYPPRQEDNDEDKAAAEAFVCICVPRAAARAGQLEDSVE